MFSDCIIHALYILLKSSSFFNLVYWWLLRFLNEGMELGKSVVGSGREKYPVFNGFSSQISTHLERLFTAVLVSDRRFGLVSSVYMQILYR